METRTSGDCAFICGHWPLNPARSTLIFIHGAGESGRLWQAQVEGLKDRANTVALDLPGHGGSGGSARKRIEDYAACDQFDVIPRLASIRRPVLVISAEDDRLTPPKYGEFLERRIPDAARTHIRDAGHFVPIEKPREVNSAIARFLDHHEL